MNSISAVLIAAFVLLPASGQPRGRSLVSAQSPKSDDFHIRLAPAQRQQLFAGQCTLITSTAALPASVKTMFASATGEPTFALANPGQKYQETDVIIGRKLPRRRLVFAGQCGERYFIHYERGGLVWCPRNT